MSRFQGDRAKLGYHTQYVVDGGKARMILAALVTPASVMDNTPRLDLERWVRFRWQVKPEIAVGDTKFGTVAHSAGLEQDGLRAYLPRTDFSQRIGLYPAESFQYHAEQDGYLCPQGQALTLESRRASEELWLYRADPAICNACPVRSSCTTSPGGRHVYRSFYQEELNRAKGYRETEAYQKALRNRQVWVEPLLGEVKQGHPGARFRLRGLRKVNIEGVIRAAGQNIKRLVSPSPREKPQTPTGGAVLLFPTSFCFRCRRLAIGLSSLRLPTSSTRCCETRHVESRLDYAPSTVKGSATMRGVHRTLPAVVWRSLPRTGDKRHLRSPGNPRTLVFNSPNMVAYKS